MIWHQRSAFMVVTVLAVVPAAVYAFAPIVQLEGYWQFDQNANDSSGASRDLTLQGNAGFTASGLIGSALSLPADPLASARRLTDDQAFDFGGQDFTIQLWASFNSTAGEQTLIEKFLGPAGPGWTLTKLPSNNLQFYADGWAVNSSVLSIATDAWHHILVRRAAGQLDLFFDGALVGSGGLGIVITDVTQDLRIGEREGLQEFPVNGKLDEVAIWSRALTNEDVATVYNGGAGLVLPEPMTGVLIAIAAASLLRRK